MLSFLEITFWFYFIYFWLAISVAFFIPGDLVLSKLKLTVHQRIIVATVIGMVMWGWIGYISGYLHIRWIFYLYLVISVFVWLNKGKSFVNPFKEFKNCSFDWIIFTIFILGLAVQLSAVWFIGFPIKEGLLFCCGNLTDNFWHLAVTNELLKNFPPYQPGMWGVLIKNYHYWGNLVSADFIRIFHLPIVNTQFQFFGLFLSLFFGLSAFIFAESLKIGRLFTRWFLFFLYLGGDFIYLIVSLSRKEINFTMNSLEDGSKFLTNPPRAFALVIFFCFLFLFSEYLKKRNAYLRFLIAFLIGSLVGFKVYVGIFCFVGLIFLSVYEALFKKRFDLILILIIAGLLSSAIYLPVNSNAGGFYFTGFWTIENFIVQPWMGLVRLELAKEIYLRHGNWVRVIQYEFIFMILYLTGVFGTKLIGFIQSKKSLSIIPLEMNIFLLSAISVSLITGLFFQQTVGSANTFNFTVLVFVLSSVYAAIFCFYFLKKINYYLMILFSIIIVLITVPRVIYESAKNVFKSINKNSFIISNEKLEAFRFIKQNTNSNSIFLVSHKIGFKEDYQSPYVSFFTDRPMYLSGNGLLDLFGIDSNDRKKVDSIVFNYKAGEKLDEVIKSSMIDYLILEYPIVIDNIAAGKYLNAIYKNKEITIAKLRKIN